MSNDKYNVNLYHVIDYILNCIDLSHYKYLVRCPSGRILMFKDYPKLIINEFRTTPDNGYMWCSEHNEFGRDFFHLFSVPVDTLKFITVKSGVWEIDKLRKAGRL